MKKQTLSRHERADDIARLKADLNLPNLDYIDISAQIELNQALKRWPLLVELAAVAKASAQPEPGIGAGVEPGKRGARS